MKNEELWKFFAILIVIHVTLVLGDDNDGATTKPSERAIKFREFNFF